MQVIITAVGPDNRGLADPIIHHVTGLGANIAEIQMYDHDEECLFAMLLRIELDAAQFAGLRHGAGRRSARQKRLSIRVWSPDVRAARPRLAICTTIRPEPPLALLRAIRDKTVNADAAVMIGNRPHCRWLAEQFGVDWHLIGDETGAADDERLIEICDEYDVDYIILARYMRILRRRPAGNTPADGSSTCTTACCRASPACGRITRPTPAGCSPTAPPATSSCPSWTPAIRSSINRRSPSRQGMKLDEIIRRGQEDNEPHCLVEGVRRVRLARSAAALPPRRGREGVGHAVRAGRSRLPSGTLCVESSRSRTSRPADGTYRIHGTPYCVLRSLSQSIARPP